MMMRSKDWFKRAKHVIPGGVNSPVRAFGSIGDTPRFIDAASGAELFDVDGNAYIDYVGSWGPMILGHSHPNVQEAVSAALSKGSSFGAATAREVEIAELITSNVPNIDMIRMVNSGTEAVMSALRLARGYTKKDKIVKFAGCYHGHCDGMLVKAGSGLLGMGEPNSAGVTQATAEDTLLAEYNDVESVAQLFDKYKHQIAAVIVEPVAANMGVVLPKAGFLQQLRDICNTHSALLIFDEVITGFRLCFGGAQAYFGVDADLVTYGKIIGGGLPVGAYGGRADIMRKVAPLGDVYQAGTLSGNPLAMAAGLATLTELRANPRIYDNINDVCRQMASKIRSMTDLTVNQIGSLLCLFMTKEPVVDFRSAMKSDVKQYAAYCKAMLNGGIYIAPAQFEAMFLSNAHSAEQIETTIQVMKKVLTDMGLHN